MAELYRDSGNHFVSVITVKDRKVTHWRDCPRRGLQRDRMARTVTAVSRRLRVRGSRPGTLVAEHESPGGIRDFLEDTGRRLPVREETGPGAARCS